MHDVTGDFVYVRLRRSVQTEPTGYSAPALDGWARRLRICRPVASLMTPVASTRSRREKKPRATVSHFISGAKIRAPAAALALIELLAR